MTRLVCSLKVNKHSIELGLKYFKEKDEIVRLENGLTINQQNELLKRRKVVRPSLEELEECVKLIGKVATGIKYDVTYPTITKWIKFYKKYKF